MLGKTNMMHVVQSKSINLVKPFAATVKRCDELLLRIKEIEKVLL